jgi:lysozyme
VVTLNLDLLEAELRRDEGVRYSVYSDTKGIPTVGVGHNCQVSPLPVGWECPLADAQINQLLARDISTSLAKLDANIPWWRQMDDVRQRVLANMAFNMGVGNATLGTGVLGFKTALGAMQRGSYAIAAAAMVSSQWYRQTGDRAKRLCQAMETGTMPAADGVL